MFALEHIGQRFQRPATCARHWATVTAIIEQRIDRFLQHPLFIPDNHVRRPELEQILQPVIPVDDAPVQIIQIAGGKSAAFERHERSQVRRNYRQHFDDEPLRPHFRGQKCLGNF